MRRIATSLALVALCGFAASCAGADRQGTAAQQMTSWVKGTSYGATQRTLVADAKKAAVVLSTGTPAEIHTVCGVFLVDVEQANGVLPTPDQQATDLLSTSYTALGGAAHNCFDAPGSPAKRASFAVNKSKGLAALSEATGRIEAVLGIPLAQVGGATEGVTGGTTGNTP